MTTAPGTSLIDVPDVKGLLKREWPRLALRAGLAVLVPLFTARLIDAFGLTPQLSQFVPIVTFLQPGTPGYGLRVVMFLVLILVVGSFALRQRTGQALLVIATGVILAVGFNHSQLQWTRLFDMGTYSPGAPTAGAWAYAVALLSTIVVYILAEETLDTKSQQTARALPEDETEAVAKVARMGAAFALLGGAALVGALLAAGALLNPAVRAQSVFPRLNPVFVLFALGLLLALAIGVSARKAKVGAQPEPATRALLPPPPPPSVRVPVQEGPASFPPPPPPPRK